MLPYQINKEGLTEAQIAESVSDIVNLYNITDEKIIRRLKKVVERGRVPRPFIDDALAAPKWREEHPGTTVYMVNGIGIDLPSETFTPGRDKDLGLYLFFHCGIGV